MNDRTPIKQWSWGLDYGRDLLTDINKCAHAAGTSAITRDCLRRAYREISRLQKATSPEPVAEKESEDDFNPVREALESAEDALANCYELQSYPADGKTSQDYALAKVRSALATFRSSSAGSFEK